jgi:hypothetical protein
MGRGIPFYIYNSFSLKNQFYSAEITESTKKRRLSLNFLILMPGHQIKDCCLKKCKSNAKRYKFISDILKMRH